MPTAVSLAEHSHEIAKASFCTYIFLSWKKMARLRSFTAIIKQVSTVNFHGRGCILR